MWRLTVLALVVGGGVVALVLMLGWYTGLSKDERASASDPFKKEEQRRREGETLTAAKKLKQKVCHPILGYWRSTMVGLLDVLTDVLFCLSLYNEGGGASPLFIVSAACIIVSVGFSFSATLWLYCRGAGGRRSTSRPIFSIEESSHRKIFFFLVVMLSGVVNVSLAALLPWRWNDRRGVLVRIQRLYLAAKFIEDLPQLAIAAFYLAARGVSGDMSGAAVNTAALQLAVSGVSFLLTMIFLGLQVFDSGHERAPSRWADPARKRTLSHRSPPRSTTSSLLSKAASTIAEAVAPKRQKARRGERERRAAKKAEEVRV